MATAFPFQSPVFALILSLAACSIELNVGPDDTGIALDESGTSTPTTSGDDGDSSTGDGLTTTGEIDTGTGDESSSTGEPGPVCEPTQGQMCDEIPASLCDGLAPIDCETAKGMCEMGVDDDVLCKYIAESCQVDGCESVEEHCKCTVDALSYQSEQGCARLIEVAGRGPAQDRYVVVDGSLCDRSVELQLTHYDFASTWVEIDVGTARECTAYGSPSAIAAWPDSVPAAVGDDQDLASYMVAVFADGALSDAVWLPSSLGNGVVEAPVLPVRRTMSYGWAVGGGPTDCTLVP